MSHYQNSGTHDLTGYRYKAFISYSHQDERWARWLQRALERYQVPRSLVGKQTDHGEIPSRLGQVFRDREDLSSAASLTDTVQHELESAETLVVICSPAAAQSRWVKEEVRAFRELGRPDRIFALIVAGDPQSDDPAEQCFPSTLVTGEDGSTTEPLAADVRKWADGKVLGKLKLVAGILGIRLDELRQREMHRRRQRTVSVVAGVSAVVLLTAFLSLSAISNRKVADQRRANTEDLVSFMLGKLEDLSPVEGLDVIEEGGEEMLRSTEQWAFQNLDNQALLQRALEWRDEGIAARSRKDGPAAMTAFKRSLAALVNLYLRDKDNPDSLFEVGQAEFWVGYAHMDNGDLDLAEKSMTRYGVVARRLINADPKSADNVMELSYTLMNLAAIETLRVNGDVDKAIYLAQAALEYNQLALVLEPDNQGRMTELAGSYAWLADAWLGVCNLDKARQSRSEGATIIKQMLGKNPGDLELLVDLSHAMGGLSNVQYKLGQTAKAEESIRASATLLDDVIKGHSNPVKFTWERSARLGKLGLWMVETGRLEEGQSLISESAAVVDELYEQEEDPSLESMLDMASSLHFQTVVAMETGNMEEALNFNSEAIRVLSQVVSKSPDSVSVQHGLASALFQYWQLHDALPLPEWQAPVKDYYLGYPPVRNCELAELAAHQAVMHEDLNSARFFSDYLAGKGYQDPGFMRFCRTYDLCN